MLKYTDYDIVFSEIPDEITLAVSLSNCPNHCKGCHSPWLWEDRGAILDVDTLCGWIRSYQSAITCVCFMGGDNDHDALGALAKEIRETFPSLKTAWYSGLDQWPGTLSALFDYIKIGHYEESLGGLRSRR